MKPTIPLAAAFLLSAAPGLHGQGSLTPPPGVPGPVMKSIDQVEARTPLVAGQPGVAIDANGTITISQSGSYYLTKNLTITTASANGITIDANDVTLDLNGFSLICTGVNGGNAVHLSDIASILKNTRIRNGSIVGGTTHIGPVFTEIGWDYGVYGLGSVSTCVSDLAVRGTRRVGIELRSQNGTNSAERCTADGIGSIGIIAPIVIDCHADNTLLDGIYLAGSEHTGSATNSSGRSIGNGWGIDARGGTVENCKGVSVSARGIQADIASNSIGISTSGIGLEARSASNSRGTSTSNTGLSAETATNCIGISTGGPTGISVTGTASFCRGTRSGGVAMSAGIAIGCTSGGGTITSAQKHLGTP